MAHFPHTPIPQPAAVSFTPRSMHITNLVDAGPAFEVVDWSTVIGVEPETAVREVLDAGGLALARRDLPARPIAARREIEAAAQRIRDDLDLLVRALASRDRGTEGPDGGGR